MQRVVRAKKTSVPSLETYAFKNNDWENLTPTKVPTLRRKMSDPDIHHGTSGILAAMVCICRMQFMFSFENAKSFDIVCRAMLPIFQNRWLRRKMQGAQLYRLPQL